VERAADLFIEQDIARELLDVEIRADGELAEVREPSSLSRVFSRKS
jgi:hypothetical protein